MCLDKWILYIKINNVTQVGGALMVIGGNVSLTQYEPGLGVF